MASMDDGGAVIFWNASRTWPAPRCIVVGVDDPTASAAHQAVIIRRSAALDRIAFAAAVIMPVGITVCSGLVVGAFFGVVALPFVALGLRNVLRQPPLLRGDGRGLWFGRGRIVPWHEVSLIFESNGGYRGSDAIGFELARRTTWLRLPIEKQVSSLFAYGQTAVTTRYVTGVSRTLLIAQLQAIRTLAVGTEDGVAVGAAAIPGARLIDR